MDIDKLYQEAICNSVPSSIIFQDEYRIVLKQLGVLSEMGKKNEKRVQVVQWKKMKSNERYLDIRYFDTSKNMFSKGISLNSSEVKELINILSSFNLSELGS